MIVDSSSFWTIVGSLSVFSNRVAEGVKRALKVRFPTMTEDQVGLITIVVSFVAAVIGAFFIRLNLFDIFPPNPYTPNIPEVVGIIGAAAIATFGSESLHWFLDFLAAGIIRLEAPKAGGFSQKSETTFTPPSDKNAPGAQQTISTPAGSATLTPTAPVAPEAPVVPQSDLHG